MNDVSQRFSKAFSQQPMQNKKETEGRVCHSPERAGDGGDEEEADRHEDGAHLHPLRT